MRLHSNLITRDQIQDALAAERNAGRIASTVRFKILERHGSRTARGSFEVQLESWDQIKGDGRRVGNSGSYGGMSGGDYAATYDEWGWFLAALYRIDPTMVCGASTKYAVYADADDYRHKTGYTYELEALLPLLAAGNDPYPYRPAKGYRIGRRGAGRASYADLENRPHWASSYYTLEPRTPEGYAAFARLAR